MAKTILELKNLKKSYGTETVLNGLSLTIREGELYGFVGANGAGKTTTIRIAAGLLAPDEGTVLVEGEDLWKARSKPKTSAAIMKKIGYVPDFFGVYENFRVSEYMEFFASCYGLSGLRARRRCEMLLDQTGLYDKAEYYASSLSRGMKQRLCLARALIHDPDLLILDEPASGLDPLTRSQYFEILKELKNQGKALLISSHILSELSGICSSAGMIDNGTMIVSGTMEEIFESVDISRPILIQVIGDPTGALAVLREDPNVESVMVDGEMLKIEYIGTRADEEMLLRMMVRGGVHVTGFMRQQGDLETAFLQLAGKKADGKVLIDYEMESDIAEGNYH
ncbi:ABC-2 type transport system ATP-binding protein [[Clostridium] aminophilum]|uniref:ABC-2 type transport system ATP-binding protein n=1 Tax=[Clostridium] aminophilum TaxID=1526 RepID=A0A1I0DGF7_9FIRM|nr:ABC transporter ATP-binding protein [[Clostridium] aminophilum]SET31423.1 ABC-2 type transport system ATP-binding protein [[Clostridium] aminophilum]